MRSNVLVLILTLAFLPVLGNAQEDASHNLVLPLAQGGFVAFKSETAPIGRPRTAAAFQKLRVEFSAQAFVDDKHVIHRVLVDSQGRYLFGYDLMIEPVPASRTFTIGVAPLDSETEKKLQASRSEAQSMPIATLPQSAEPQILDDGDSFALDLLVNQTTGVKIVDRVRVSFDRAGLWKDAPRSVPRDFTLDAVALSVTNYQLMIEGDLVAEGKHGKNLAGALIWCYVEGEGRFIFSLVPRDGYEFQKVGVITDNKIEFTVQGKKYEWVSGEPILPGGGAWNLWVLHDPKYLPFGTQQTSKQVKSRLDKLDDSIKAAGRKAARIGDPTSNTFHRQAEAQRSEPEPQRFRVMVGAADRIENLLPK
jgi:hypothetical protein